VRDVADDVGTECLMRRTAAAGSGREWSADWVFSPHVPEDATQLMVAVAQRDHEPRRTVVQI
jgi:hypothetical protein